MVRDPLGRPCRRWEDDIKGLDLSDTRLGLPAGFCEHGNEQSDSIKDRELFNHLIDSQLLSMKTLLYGDDHKICIILK